VLTIIHGEHTQDSSKSLAPTHNLRRNAVGMQQLLPGSSFRKFAEPLGIPVCEATGKKVVAYKQKMAHEIDAKIQHLQPAG